MALQATTGGVEWRQFWVPGTGLIGILIVALGFRGLPAFLASQILQGLLRFGSDGYGSLIGPDLALTAAVYLAVCALVGPVFRLDMRFQRPRDIIILAAACILGPIPAAVLLQDALITGATRVQAALADITGALSLAPFALVHFGARLAGQPRPRVAGPAGRWWEIPAAAGLALLVVAFDLHPFTSDFRTSFLLFVPIAWLAAVRGVRGATIGMLVTNAAFVLGAVMSDSAANTRTADQAFLVGLDLAALFLGLIVDGREAAKRMAYTREHEYQLLAENTSDVILIISKTGTLEYVSPSVEGLLGYSRGESEGQPADVAVHRDDRTAFRDHLAEAARGGPRRFQNRLRRKDGSFVWVEYVMKAVLDPSGRGGTYLVATARDITDRRVLEDSLHQSQKLESVGRLAGGVAHDFNNLLTAILGHSSLIEDDPDTPEGIRAQIVDIRRAAERAAGLTGQLLAFARRQVTQPRTVDVNEVVSGMERLLGRVLGEDVRLRTELSPATWKVRVDPGQFEQVLMNLAVNARDAMPDGGDLRLSAGNVQIPSARYGHVADLSPGDYVAVAVSDSGQGMPPEVIERIFEPFFTTKSVGKGTGLGLAVCHGIIRQAGGQILVDSDLGAGTTFTVLLPRTTETDLQPIQRMAADPGGGGGAVVLVAEDDDLVRSLAVRVLEGAGYRVLEAENGEAARSVAKAWARPIAVLVTDVVMPDISGPQLAASLRPSQPGMRVLFMSGFPEQSADQAQQHWRLGSYLDKPFTPPDLLRRVRDLLADSSPPDPDPTRTMARPR